MLSPKPSDSQSQALSKREDRRRELDDKGKRDVLHTARAGDGASALPLAVIRQSPAPKNGAGSFARWN